MIDLKQSKETKKQTNNDNILENVFLSKVVEWFEKLFEKIVVRLNVQYMYTSTQPSLNETDPYELHNNSIFT